MSDLSAGDLLVVEYERLKDEQKHRIAARDGLLYATFAATAAVLVGTLRFGGGAGLLLMLPAVAVILGWTYLVNDQKVSAIGHYIRAELAPRLQAIVGEPVFGWETAHRGDRRRRTRKVLQLVADLAIFTVGPLVVLTVYWVNGPWTAALLTISVAETATVLALAAQILIYADLQTARRTVVPAPDVGAPDVGAPGGEGTR